MITLSGLAAVVLTAVGMAGLMAYPVRQRRHEIGIRLALGAQARDVSSLILGEGLFVAAAGGVLGVGGALSLTSILRTLLVGVAPTDPGVLIGAFLILLIITLAAAYIPLRRALRVDPLACLRFQ